MIATAAVVAGYYRTRLTTSIRRTLKILADWYRDLTTRSARLNQRLMEWPPILAAAMSDRGLCRACGVDHALKRDGRVYQHSNCPGGDQLPAPLLIRSDDS